MASLEVHLRHVINEARRKQQDELVDVAGALVEDNFDGFFSAAGGFAPELLVMFAETAAAVGGREHLVGRALHLLRRMELEDSQYRVRELLVRCLYESRRAEASGLLGEHLVQQKKFALSFLTQALDVAAKPELKDRYAFLVYNASTVFWDVVRPIFRSGWRKHMVAESQKMLDSLVAVASGGAGEKAAKGAPAGVPGGSVPMSVEPAWQLELMIQHAFNMEDDGKLDPKFVDAIGEVLKKTPVDVKGATPWLEPLVIASRAYLARGNPANFVKEVEGLIAAAKKEADDATKKAAAAPPAQKQELTAVATKRQADVSTAQALQGEAVGLLVRYKGINWETQAEGELTKAWVERDPPFKELLENVDGSVPPARSQASPQEQIVLAGLFRAAVQAQKWPLAIKMMDRISVFRAPPPRGRILIDLAMAEISVWRAKNEKAFDPVTGMLLSASQQEDREITARVQAVRACERCMMAAKRIENMDLVEDAAVILWNLGLPLLCDAHRFKIHKSLQKASEILTEVQSALSKLRVMLHFEVAKCEVAQDILTKGKLELEHASHVDYTLSWDEAKKMAAQQGIAIPDEDDPSPYLRWLDSHIKRNHNMLAWKLALYDEPSDPADIAMLLIDQVQATKASAHVHSSSLLELKFNLLQKAFERLDSRLEELVASYPSLETEVPPRPLVLGSVEPIKEIPRQAPCTVEADTAKRDAAADSRPATAKEVAESQIKRLVMLLCEVSQEAHKIERFELAAQVATKAMEIAAPAETENPGVVQFKVGIEAEGGILLARAALTRALCLADAIDQFGVLPGVVETTSEEEAEGEEKVHVGFATEESDEDDGTPPPLTAEEIEQVLKLKTDLIDAVLFGARVAAQFKQGWMVCNALVHWWNIHIGITDDNLAEKVLPEYIDGMLELHGLLVTLAPIDFHQELACSFTIALMQALHAADRTQEFQQAAVNVLPRMDAPERKEVVAHLSALCHKSKAAVPAIPPPEIPTAEGAPDPAAKAKAKPKPKAKEKAAPATPSSGEDVDPRIEGDAMKLIEAVKAQVEEKACSPAEQLKVAEEARALLATWSPNPKHEGQLSLWVELWTRLGRYCLDANTNAAAKFALMCAIKGLGGSVDNPQPQHASQQRLQWRGAAHALAGSALAALVDPTRQEKTALVRLRLMAVAQYERSAEYAMRVPSQSLAVFAAKQMWNVCVPLLDSPETRQPLIQPLLTATRALAQTKYREEPEMSNGLYQALFDCYSDRRQWDAVQAMLNEAFAIVPSKFQRQLWAMRMLALSRQGKDVAIAMGKMKETQATAQANIWLVLAHSSSKRQDQLEAYHKACDTLTAAQQAAVVEVRMDLADWLTRNHYTLSDCADQLQIAADFLLEIEEEAMEDAEEDPKQDGKSAISRGTGVSRRSSGAGSQQSSAKRSQGSRKSGASRRSRGRAGSVAGRSQASGAGGKARSAKSAGSAAQSVRSSRSRIQTVDQELVSTLHAGHYEALVRISVMQIPYARDGEEVQEYVQAAVHFVAQMFDFTVNLANKTANTMMNRAAEKKDEEAGRQSTGERASSRSGRRRRARDDDAPARPFTPPFLTPATLGDWATVGSEVVSPPLLSILNQGTEARIIRRDDSVSVRDLNAYVRPAVTFQLLLDLYDALEGLYLYLHCFPVLEMHRQFVLTVFPEDAPLRPLMLCVVDLRVCRYANIVNLVKESKDAWERAKPVVESLPASFPDFEAYLDHVRSQRQGLEEAPRVSTPKGVVPPPWIINDVVVHVVWADVARECFLRGDLATARELAMEAKRHAITHGDLRTLRVLIILIARVDHAQGKHAEAIEGLGELQDSTVSELADMTDILFECYTFLSKPVWADDVVVGAFAAVKQAAGDTETLEVPRFAKCLWRLQRLQLQSMVVVLRALPPASRDFFPQMQKVHQHQRIMREALQTSKLSVQVIEGCINFVQLMLDVHTLLERLMIQDPLNQRRSGGPLSYQVLMEHLDILRVECDEASSCVSGVVSVAVPPKLQTPIVAPVMALVTELEVCCASVRARHSQYEAGQAWEDTLEPVDLDQHFATQQITKRFLDLSGANQTKTVVEVWLDEAAVEHEKNEAFKSRARTPAANYDTFVRMGTAVSQFEPVVKFHVMGRDEDQDEEEEAVLPPPMCGSPAAAWAELGAVQIEIAASRDDAPLAATKVWPALCLDDYELRMMAVCDAQSKFLHPAPPAPPAGKGQPAAAAAAADSPEEQPDEEEVESASASEVRQGRATLEEVVRRSLAALDFVVARRALVSLVFRAYGELDAERAFQHLVMLQSVDVFVRSLEIVETCMPREHPEFVWVRQLKALQRRWLNAPELPTYIDARTSLMESSPMGDRLFSLATLPPVSELLATHIAPGTLVVSLQLHSNSLYVGAVCTVADAAATPKYFVKRVAMNEMDVFVRARRLGEINTEIEREMRLAPGFSAAMEDQYAQVCSEMDRLLSPIFQQLELSFWPLSRFVKHDSNPQRMVLLPDSSLAAFPLERLASVTRMFVDTPAEKICRDLSFHLHVYRVKDLLETVDRSSLADSLPGVSSDKFKMIVDPFAEDTLRPTEPEGSQTMFELLESLEGEKICAGGLTGKRWIASPEDFTKVLVESQAVVYLGFGKFLSAMGSGSALAALDLRHLPILCSVCRCINDTAFRRQTKGDSMKTPALLGVELFYSFSLLASMRGVRALLFTVNPLPIPAAMKVADAISRNMVTEGMTLAQALAAVFAQTVDSSQYRLVRPGGEDAVEAGEDGEDEEELPLLSFHSRAALITVGLANTGTGAAPPKGKDKGKKK